MVETVIRQCGKDKHRKKLVLTRQFLGDGVYVLLSRVVVKSSMAAFGSGISASVHF